MSYRNPFLGKSADTVDSSTGTPSYSTPTSTTTSSSTSSPTSSAPVPNDAAVRAQLFQPTPDAIPFQAQSAQGLAYPAPGNRQILLTYRVPSGMVLVVNALAVVNVGPALVDYANILTFRVLRNGAGERGFANLVAQVGTLAQPQGVQMVFKENETLQIVVDVPAGPAVPAGNVPAARVLGFTKLAPPMPNTFRQV